MEQKVRLARSGGPINQMKELQDYWYGLLTEAPEGGPAGTVRKKHKDEPKSLGGSYPVGVVPLFTGRGSNPTAPQGVPGEYVGRLRIYDLYTAGEQDAAGAQEDAERRAIRTCTEVADRVVNAAMQDLAFRVRVQDWYVGAVDYGPVTDRLGRALKVGGNIQFRLELEIVVVP